MINKVLVIAICITLVFFMFTNKETTFDLIMDYVENAMISDRIKDVGEDFNLMDWGLGFFQINHHKNGLCLELCKDRILNSKNAITILGGVYKHKFQSDKLFVFSDMGFAVIYPENNCKVLTSEENRIKVENVQDYNLIYINDFSEFSKEEQSVFLNQGQRGLSRIKELLK